MVLVRLSTASTVLLSGRSTSHMEGQPSWCLPLKRFMSSQVAQYTQRTVKAAGSKSSLVYIKTVSFPLSCLLTQVFGHYGLQWKMQNLHRKMSLRPYFADGILALADNTHDLHNLVRSICDSTRGPGLAISGKKTKNMIFSDYQPCMDIFLNQQKI